MTKKNEKLIQRFNEMFPVGSQVMWRSVGRDPVPHSLVTVRSPAYDHYGMPVAFFEEKSGFCSIDPMFVDYQSGVVA